MSDEQQALSPAAVVRLIKASIRQANIGGTDQDLVVTGIELTLKTILIQTDGGEFEWKVPFIGLILKGRGALTNSDTSTLTLSLVPPDYKGHQGAAGLDAGSLQDEIVYGVADIRKAIAEAAFEEPTFRLDKGAIDIEFVATKEGSLSLLVSGEHKDEVTHSMKLALGRREDLAKAQA